MEDRFILFKDAAYIGIYTADQISKMCGVERDTVYTASDKGSSFKRYKALLYEPFGFRAAWESACADVKSKLENPAFVYERKRG